MTTRVLIFIAFSLVYWFMAVSLIGAFLFASICHYPDVPGCKTEFTLPMIIATVLIALYFGLLAIFIRHLRRIRSTDQ